MLFAKGLIYGPAEHDTCDMGMGSNMKVVDDQYMLYYFSVSMQVRISIYCNIHTVLFVAFSFQIRNTMIVLPRQARDKQRGNPEKAMCVLAGCPESTCDCTLGGGGADDETAAYSVAAAAALCAARPPPPPPPPPPGSPLPAGYCGAVSAGGSIVAVRKTPFLRAMFTQKGSVCPDRLKVNHGKS